MNGRRAKARAIAGPWPVTSRLAVLRKGCGHSHRSDATERARRFGAARVGDHACCGARFGQSSGCARGLDRLQKSTGDVWPVAPAGDESAETMSGLAPARVSGGGAKERRKPDHRWLNRDTGGGLPTLTGNEGAQVSLGSTWRWKAFWVVKTVSLDEEAAEAALVLREPRRNPSQAERDRGRQRLVASFTRGR